jgi:hypothetical protein
VAAESNTAPEPTPATSRPATKGARQTSAEPPRTDYEKGVEAREAGQEGPVLSDDLISTLHLVEGRFDQAPASERRLFLTDWLMKFRQRLGHFRCIEELIDGLIELERGNATPLLTPQNTGGRPTLRLIIEDVQSGAALAMEASMLAGMSKQEAAHFVARRVGYSPTDRAAWKKVAQWREDLARAASGKGRYSEDYRTHARIHAKKRAQLIEAIKAGGQDARSLRDRELGRVDQLRKIANREKGADLSSI